MKKNIARYMWVVAVIFFLWPHVGHSDHEAKPESLLTIVVSTQSKPEKPDLDGALDAKPVPAQPQTSPSLVQLMTHIESSLKTIENAVVGTQNLKDSSLKNSDETQKTSVLVDKFPADSVLLAAESSKPEDKVVVAVADKPKAASSDKIISDDVEVAPAELSTLSVLSDESEIIPSAGHDIKLCASMPLTGSMALVGRDYLTGITLVFDKFNRAGGLDKKYLLKYSTIDDRYISTAAKENVMKSLKDSPFFVGNFGSHLLSTVKGLVQNKNVLMLFPTAGDMGFRSPDYRYLINLRPSMNTELRALIKYAVNKQQRKKIAVFYEENQWGKAGLAAIESTLAEFGLTVCAKANYPSNTIAVMPAATEIIRSRPDAVICVSTYRPTYNFIQLVLNEGFQHCLFLGLGPATPMQQLLKKSRGVTIATTSVVPDPAKSKIPIVEAYRKDMTRYFPLRELSQYSLEGYIAGSIFVSALKQLEAPYTVGKIVSFFEGLSKKDFGGFKINFNPTTRELSSRVWINKGTQDEAWDDSFSE